MTKKKRLIMIEENLNKIRYFREVKTQELRVKLIAELEKPSTEALNIAGSPHTENRDDRAKICAYMARAINTLGRMKAMESLTNRESLDFSHRECQSLSVDINKYKSFKLE
jgi:hypothetical protein